MARAQRRAQMHRTKAQATRPPMCARALPFGAPTGGACKREMLRGSPARSAEARRVPRCLHGRAFAVASTSGARSTSSDTVARLARPMFVGWTSFYRHAGKRGDKKVVCVCVFVCVYTAWGVCVCWGRSRPSPAVSHLGLANTAAGAHMRARGRGGSPTGTRLREPWVASPLPRLSRRGGGRRRQTTRQSKGAWPH